MKIGILSESIADEAAIKILAEAALQRPIQLVASGRLRAGGWSAAIEAVSVELKHLHFRTEAEGLIIVVDSDDSPVHEPSHLASPDEKCRVCQISRIVATVQANLRPLPQRPMVKIAIGLPVPAIEAWFRCGLDPHAAEDRYVRAFREGRKLSEARWQLKRDVYGSDRPSIVVETEVAIREATRLIKDLDRLRTQFPRGFGRFYETLASWR